jgi:dihydroxyacetone kinase
METLKTTDIIAIVDKMAEVAIANEVAFCEVDSVAGDGDFGMSLAKGFKQLKTDWHDLETDNIGVFLKSCGSVILEYCGGASGPIWGSAFRAAAKKAGGAVELDLKELTGLLYAAIDGIQKTGERSFGRGAVVGDKTLIDALVPATQALEKASIEQKDLLSAMELGAKAAVAGAESTKKIAARMGRAANVGDRSLDFPDAGAYGVGVMFTEIAKFMKARAKK